MEKQFLERVQRAGWRIEKVGVSEVVAACNASGCNLRARFRQSTAVPLACEVFAQPADVTVASFDDIRLALRARREQLALSIVEVEEAAGVAQDHFAKAEKETPTRVPNIEILMEWAAALGLEIVLRPASLPPKTLRTIADTRGQAAKRSKVFARLQRERSRA